jgi:hypothetical protein
MVLIVQISTPFTSSVKVRGPPLWRASAFLGAGLSQSSIREIGDAGRRNRAAPRGKSSNRHAVLQILPDLRVDTRRSRQTPSGQRFSMRRARNGLVLGTPAHA